MKNMKTLDIAVPVLFILSLAVISFFWGCHLDLYVTVLAGVIAAVTILTSYVQHKKIKELDPTEEK